MTGGYLDSAAAHDYLTGRTTKSAAAKRVWTRRHLMGAVPYHDVPGAGPVFSRADLNQWIAKFRQEPVDLDVIVRDVMRRPPKRGTHGRFERKGAA